MQIEVNLSLEVDTDLESVEDIVNHIDFFALTNCGDDVVDVNDVEVINY